MKCELDKSTSDVLVISFLKLILCFHMQLEVQYFHHHATVTTAITHNQSPGIDLSATIGTTTFALGAEAGYEPSSAKLTKYTAGISVTKPDSCASIVL